MASTRSTIEIIIEGITRGLTGAAAEAEAATRRVEAAEENVNRARARSEEAAGRLQVAEQRLEQARSAQGAATQRISDQETRINDARARSQQAADRLGQAETRLDDLRRNGGSAREIAAAEQQINRARRDSEASAGQLQAAERRLEDLRRQQGSSALRVAQAEQALARARRNSQSSASDLERAEAELLRRRNELDDADRRGSPLRSFFAGIAEGINPLRALATLIGDVTTRMGGFGEVLGAIGGPIVQAIVGIIQITAVMALWVEIIGVIGGLLGQALAGAPALLFALAAAAGTVVLGLNGIKKAAEVMQPALHKLEASVSAVFERQLTPVFRELAGILPQLTQRFDAVAVAISGIARDAVGVLTTAHGVGQLNIVLAGTASFLTGLSFGVRDFLRGLLDGAAAAAPAMAGLGTAFGNILSRIGDVFTRLGADGTIQKAVQGLASTLNGLSAVIGPIIELLIRMGAALGDSVGVALTNLGGIIQTTIPFFEAIAHTAGVVLVDAFQQLRGPIEELLKSVFPGFQSGLQGFAAVMHSVVLPALAGFINWIRTDGIPGLIAFTQGMIINLTAAGSAVLGFVSGALGALQSLFTTLGVATGNPAFLQIAGQIGVAKAQVDGFKTSLDQVHDKTVALQANVKGEDAVKALTTAIVAVVGKTVSTISNVFGTPENRGLRSAIDTVIDKTVRSVSNVTGTQQNLDLRSAIDRVIDKTVNVAANVAGTGAVQALVSAINGVHSVTAIITTITRQIQQAFASGGLAPGGVPILVGEQGPELITLPRGGGFVYTATQTRALLNSSANGGTGGDPITVTVNISQNAIAGIAEVVINRRDRTTRRTVLAGSGTTF